MLFRKLCPICQTESDLPCERCLSRLEPLPHPLNLSLASADSELALGVRALYSYDARSSRLVLTLKKRRAMWLVHWIAAQLAPLAFLELQARQTPHADPAATCLTWIPAAKSNLRRRGYDQAELLAQATAKILGLPAVKLLSRNHDRPQVGREHRGRLAGPALRPRRHSRDWPTVLIVDDVITTGSSMLSGATLLRSQGVSEVGALAVCYKKLQ